MVIEHGTRRVHIAGITAHPTGAWVAQQAGNQGEHVLHCSLVVGASIADAVREGYRANLPRREVEGAGPIAPLVAMDHQAVVVEAVKLAEYRGGDVVVRLYDTHGGRAHARLRAAFPVAAVTETDLLERPLPTTRALIGDRATDEAVLELRPFQIVTLRLRPAHGGQVRL